MNTLYRIVYSRDNNRMDLFGKGILINSIEIEPDPEFPIETRKTLYYYYRQIELFLADNGVLVTNNLMIDTINTAEVI